MKRAMAIAIFSLALVCENSAAQTPDRQSDSNPPPPAKIDRTIGNRFIVDHGDAHIDVIAQGSGPVIVILLRGRGFARGAHGGFATDGLRLLWSVRIGWKVGDPE
jgi:hypothetical protein